MRKLTAQSFELGFPEGWVDLSTITIVAPPTDPTFAPNVQVNQEPLPPDRTVQQMFGDQRTELSRLRSFQLHEAGDRLLGGQRAEYHAYSWQTPQGITVRQLQLATLRSGMVITVTCSGLDREWPQLEAAFEMVLAGFRFRAPGGGE